jgi:ABC-type multidrug transport system, ATPase and permease components
MKTEAAIVEAMERLIEGRTSFIIAHRPSTLSHCSLTLKLECGQLIEVQPKPHLRPAQEIMAGAFAAQPD